jgi:hypothetical protein
MTCRIPISDFPEAENDILIKERYIKSGLKREGNLIPEVGDVPFRSLISMPPCGDVLFGKRQTNSKTQRQLTCA